MSDQEARSPFAARTYAFYAATSGLFTGRHVTCQHEAIARNTPDGCAAVEGRYDKLSQRVDLATGQVVAYERPASEIAAEQQAARECQARQRIAALEGQQARRVRELLAPNDARLEALDAEIATLRADL